MAKFIQVTDNFAIAAQLAPEDFARAAQAGFRTIINNRPDGEEPAQLTASEGAREARAHGLRYEHIPATKHDLLTDPVVGQMATVVAASQGPVLAHCKSGQRSAVVWAAAAARQLPVAEVLQALKGAGIDGSFLRDELDRQADRARWAHAAPPERAVSADVAPQAA